MMRLKEYRQYLISLPVMGAAVMLSLLIQPHADDGSVVMVYMLAVVLTAFYLSIGPAVMVSFFGVVVFDYFNLPPFMTFTRSPLEYGFTLGVMVVTAVTISKLATRLRLQVQDSGDREARTAALYALSAELANMEDIQYILDITRRHIAHAFHALIEMQSSDTPDSLKSWPFSPRERALVQQSGQVLCNNTPDMICVCGRIRLSGGQAVLVLAAAGPRWLSTPEQLAHLQAMLNLAELAVERYDLRQRVQSTELRVQQESLRNSILNALSHDLRTPLATIIGASSSLLDHGDSFNPEDRLRMRRVIYEEAQHMQGMMENLLDLARLQGDMLRLSREWQAMEEIVGSAMTTIRRQITTHRIEVQVPDDLPLIRCDSLLLERVLINLVENAAKYSPPGSLITIRASCLADCLYLQVEDEGPGIPDEHRESVFEPFVRHLPTAPGVGLGLTICKRIVEAHQGRIRVESSPAGGARVVIELPAPDDVPGLIHESSEGESA